MAEISRLPHPITAEDLPYLPDDDDRVELVRAEIVREPPPGEEHGGVTGILIGHLFAFVHGRKLGRIYSEMGFILARDPDTVRAPDAAFVSTGRIENAGRGGPYFVGAPDLAVEVLSPGNTRREVAEKVAEYLAAGGRAVWVVDPRSERITVHQPGSVPRHLSREDTLDGAPVLEGFRLPVAEFFGFGDGWRRPRAE